MLRTYEDVGLAVVGEEVAGGGVSGEGGHVKRRELTSVHTVHLCLGDHQCAAYVR